MLIICALWRNVLISSYEENFFISCESAGTMDFVSKTVGGTTYGVSDGASEVVKAR
jgi:hypothetical protein